MSDRKQAIRTQILLILALSVITAGAKLVSLFAIRAPLQASIAQNLSSELRHSLSVFEDMQVQHLAALNRENALLADLPSMKALMTTRGQRTTRREILQANHALLESERLATIGRTAGSVSSDLRHSFAAIDANSEFLASDSVLKAERDEVLVEIRNE